MGQHAIHSLTLGSIYALLAAGLTLMYGARRSLYFAYGTLYVVGGYVAWWTIRFNHPIGMALGYAVPLCALLGVCLFVGGRVMGSRRSGRGRLLSGAGFLVCLAAVCRLVFGPHHRKVIAIDSHQIHHVGPLMLSDMHWLVLGSAFVCLMSLQGFLTTSSIGQSLHALCYAPAIEWRDGRREFALRLIACALSAALAGVGGVLAALYLNDVHPDMGIRVTHKIVTLVLIGTLGSLRGAVGIAFALALVEGMLLPVTRMPVPSEAFLLLALVVASLWHAPHQTCSRHPLSS